MHGTRRLVTATALGLGLLVSPLTAPAQGVTLRANEGTGLLPPVDPADRALSRTAATPESHRFVARRATDVTTVRGHDLARAEFLQFQNGQCGAPWVDADQGYTPLFVNSGSQGTARAIGYSTDAGGSARGVLGFAYEAPSMTYAAVDVYSPSAASTGNILAVFYEDIPGYGLGAWWGVGDWYDDQTGWGTLTLHDATLSWYFVQGGTVVGTAPDATVPAFTTSRDLSSGNLGVTGGCDGNDYYLDNLRLVGTLDDRYDFERAASRAYTGFEGRPKASSLSFGYRQARWVWGDAALYENFENYNGRDAGWYWAPPTPIRLYKKAYGASSFSLLSSAIDTTLESSAWFKVAPKKRTVYQARYPDGYGFPARSATIVANVRRGVFLTVYDKSLYAGQNLVTYGKLDPRDRGVKLFVQRRTSSGWKTMRSGYSGTGGAYRMATRITAIGSWRVRVVAAAAKGNLKSISPVRLIEVKRRPAKPQPNKVETSDGSDDGTTYVAPPPAPQKPSSGHDYLPRGR